MEEAVHYDSIAADPVYATSESESGTQRRFV
jgi:hypothetical protein